MELEAKKTIKKKVLFVCTANKLRSLTAEKIFISDNRFYVRSAGTDNAAPTPINQDLIDWADYIFVMEKMHKNYISKRFKNFLTNKRLIILNIPDEYDYMDLSLIEILKNRINSYFGIH